MGVYQDYTSPFNVAPPTSNTSIIATPLLACRDNLLNLDFSTSSNIRTNVMTKLQSLSSIDTIERSFLTSTTLNSFITTSLNPNSYKVISGEAITREKVLYYIGDSLFGRDITTGVTRTVDQRAVISTAVSIPTLCSSLLAVDTD